METAITKQDNGQAIVIAPVQMDLIKRTIANGATNDELQLFIYDCQRRGVHPLDKLIHFTKRGNKYTPITSIDFLRMKAESTGNYAGNDDPVYEYDAETSHLSKATVTIWKIVNGQKCGFTASARWSQYYPGDQQGFMWKKMPELMLGKCAEALALRKAFPGVLAGLYTTEEMDQAGPAQKQEVVNSEPKEKPKTEPEPETINVRPEEVRSKDKLAYEDDILPIGRNKGKMFKDLSSDTLKKAVEWMKANAPDKFATVIQHATDYLNDSGMPL